MTYFRLINSAVNNDGLVGINFTLMNEEEFKYIETSLLKLQRLEKSEL